MPLQIITSGKSSAPIVMGLTTLKNEYREFTGRQLKLLIVKDGAPVIDLAFRELNGGITKEE